MATVRLPRGQKSDRQTFRGQRLRWTLVLTLTTFALASCATGNGSDPMLASGAMSIESKVRPGDGIEMAAVRNTSKTAGDAGFKGGAAVGAVTSLGCGPAVVICLPFFAVGGAYLGGTAGSVAGAVSDAFDLFPPEVAGRIESVLTDIRRRRDFYAELREAVSESVPEDRQTEPNAADANVYVAPEGMHFVQDEADMFALRMVGSMYVEKRTGGVTQEGESRQYEYVTAEMPVDFWLSDEGAPFDRAFTEGVQKIGLMMAWDLAGRQHE